MWQELCQVRETIDGSWCLAGDFNQVLYDYEKEGGVPLGSSAAASFADCINTCQLLDLGFKGQQFTWKRGDLKERLDRVLCTTDWQAMYPNCSVTHLPLVGSDHYGLWLRTLTRRVPNGSYFKFLAPWIDHPNFVNQVSSSWIESDSWDSNIQRLTSNLREWNRDVFGHIFRKKHRIIKRLEGIGNKLMSGVSPRLEELRKHLWADYNQLLQQEETY